MGCTLPDGTAPGQTGRGPPPRADGPPPSEAGFGKAQLWDLHLGETIGLPESI